MKKKIQNLLRFQSTEIERKLWNLLRSRRFFGYKFRRQVKMGNYVVDFLCYKERLIVEIDGSQHNEEKNKKYDQERTSWLEKQGFKVIRFWNNEISNHQEAVLNKIYGELSK